MDIWESNKLLLFIGFVIPGFVSLKTYNLLVPSSSGDTSAQIMEAVAYSCVNYALFIGPIYWIDSIHLWSAHPAVYVTFAVVVLFVGPVSWAVLYKMLRETRFLRRALPHPTPRPWDFVFGKPDGRWIIVTLKDGTKIAGRYDSESFASSAPEPEQLYLEETWVLNEDGGFERPRTDSAGIMILSTEMIAIEFFKMNYGAANDGPQLR